MSALELGNGLRVVDLSKELDPATETRRCHLFRFNTGGPIPDFHTIMDLTSHLGTQLLWLFLSRTSDRKILCCYSVIDLGSCR